MVNKYNQTAGDEGRLARILEGLSCPEFADKVAKYEHVHASKAARISKYQQACPSIFRRFDLEGLGYIRSVSDLEQCITGVAYNLNLTSAQASHNRTR